MLADSLRKSILQAAIEGKLTEREPGDGDARDLLAEIRQEKARLVKEGKIRRSNPLPPVEDDEIPFEIPENWCWVRLGSIFNLQAGKFIDGNSIQSKGRYPCFGGNGLRGYVDRFNRSGKFAIIGRQGALCGNINVANGEFYATEHAVVVDFYKDCDVDWTAHFLTALNLNQYATATAQPGLAVSKINHVLIPLPPLAEQRRIVARLEELLPLVDELGKDEKELDAIEREFPDAIRKSLLQAAIEGKLTKREPGDGDARDLLAEIQKEKARLVKEGKIRRSAPLPPVAEDEIPFEIPDNWRWVRLGEITSYANSRQVNQREIPAGALVVELEDIEKDTCRILEKHYDRTPGSSKNQFSSGDVLYGKLRLYLKKTVVLQEDGYCSTEIVPFRGYGGIESKYLMYIMISPEIDSQINSLTYGMDMPRLGRKDAVLLPVPLPPLAEQRRIVARLEGLLPLVDELGKL